MSWRLLNKKKATGHVRHIASNTEQKCRQRCYDLVRTPHRLVISSGLPGLNLLIKCEIFFLSGDSSSLENEKVGFLLILRSCTKSSPVLEKSCRY